MRITAVVIVLSGLPTELSKVIHKNTYFGIYPCKILHTDIHSGEVLMC